MLIANSLSYIQGGATCPDAYAHTHTLTHTHTHTLSLTHTHTHTHTYAHTHTLTHTLIHTRKVEQLAQTHMCMPLTCLVTWHVYGNGTASMTMFRSPTETVILPFTESGHRVSSNSRGALDPSPGHPCQPLGFTSMYGLAGLLLFCARNTKSSVPVV